MYGRQYLALYSLCCKPRRAGRRIGTAFEISIQVMIARALGSHDPDPAVRNPDWLAERFVGPAERAALAGTVWETALDLDWREAVKIPDLDRQVRVHLVRTSFTDEKLVKALRSRRSTGGHPGRRIRHSRLSVPVNVSSCSFYRSGLRAHTGIQEEACRRDLWWASRTTLRTHDRLQQGQTRRRVGPGRVSAPSELSFFVWEGVAYYLPESAVLEPRLSLRMQLPGTTIAMDFIYRFVIDKIGRNPISRSACSSRSSRDGETTGRSGRTVDLRRSRKPRVNILPTWDWRLSRFCLRARPKRRRGIEPDVTGSLVGSEAATFRSVGCFVEAVVPMPVTL